jgi:hypothetical protein
MTTRDAAPDGASRSARLAILALDERAGGV